MATADLNKSPAARRKAKREQQYASTLVHYLGVDQALAVCRENMWHRVKQAIVEQQGAMQANAAHMHSASSGAGREAVA